MRGDFLSSGTNLLTTKSFRDENIIKHPVESYAQVNTRTIRKLRKYAEKAKRKWVRSLCGFFNSLFWACLGAILGYLPDIIKNGSNSDFFSIYKIVIMVCLASLVLCLSLYSKVKGGDANLIEIIEEELSEEFVPINSASIKPNMYPTNNVDFG